MENLITFEDNKDLKIKLIYTVLEIKTKVGEFITVKGIPSNTVFVAGFLFNYIKPDKGDNIYEYWDVQVTYPSSCKIKKIKDYYNTGYAAILAFYK